MIWFSGVVLGGAIVWNVVRGDWTDGLFLLGLGVGGALLLSARRHPDDAEGTRTVLRWSGLLLLGGIVVTQVILLVRYLLLTLQ